MPCHDHVHLAGSYQYPVGIKLAGLPGLGDIDKTLMAVGGGGAMSGEMLERGQQPRRMVRLDEGRIIQCHCGRISAEGAAKFANYRIFRIEIEVSHGAEIDSKTQLGDG